MPASNQHFKDRNEGIHNPSKLGENSYLLSISYFYFCFPLWRQKWAKYNKLKCHILHCSQKTELTTKNLLLRYKKLIISRIQISLNAKHAWCKGSVFLKKTRCFCEHRVIQASPWYSCKTSLISAFSVEIVSSCCQLPLGSIYDAVMALKG